MIKWLSVILFLKAALMATIILFAGIGLGPDEAQYWTWSQALDWGYYSKPPGIAWQIRLGTELFGQTEWGVRFLSVIISAAQAFAIYYLALSVGLMQRTAFWCALFMAFCPIGLLGSLLAITDVGFLLCWTGACISVTAALRHGKAPNIFAISLWIIGGALFKWPIYLFWIFVIACRPLLFPQLRLPTLLMGICLSLIGLLPSLWWNISHDWATFRHVSATLQGGSGHRAQGNLLELVGMQALLLSPILFFLLLGGLWHAFSRRKELPAPLYFCGFVTGGSLLIAFVISLFQKVQGNWVIFAYPTGLIILGWYTIELHKKTLARWAKGGLLFSITLLGLIAILPSWYTNASYAPPYAIRPLMQNVGWNSLAQELVKLGYDPDKHFLIGDKYQTTSILSFYGPEQQRAYFLNLQNTRNNQFSYWPSLQQEQKGKVGFFLWIENSPRFEKNRKVKEEFYLDKLQIYFEKVELVALSPLIQAGEDPLKGALIFRCENCKEINVQHSSMY